MGYKQGNNNQGESLLPQIINEEDRQVLEILKAVTEQASQITGHAANIAQLEGLKAVAGQASQITANLTNIAQSAVAIRQSDNNVLIACQKIAADTEKWHDFLRHTFSGRDKAIDAIISQIENGVKQNSNELILKAMDSLTTIVASSPWPDFDSFHKLIESGGEIELF